MTYMVYHFSWQILPPITSVIKHNNFYTLFSSFVMYFNFIVGGYGTSIPGWPRPLQPRPRMDINPSYSISAKVTLETMCKQDSYFSQSFQPFTRETCYVCSVFQVICWILKNKMEINSEYSQEGLMLKLKLQYFDCLMQRANSLEKTPMLGKIGARRRR